MNILVVYGGNSSEREVSLRSGRNVRDALCQAGHTVTVFDPIEDSDYTHLEDVLVGIAVVFPALHGKGGEDGQLQAILERMKVPFVGTGATASRNCFDKLRTLSMLKAAGLPVPATEVVKFDQLASHPLVRKPFVLKPQDEGSSVDTFLVRDISKFDLKSYREVFDRRGVLLIEELVEGIELTVPVLGNDALPVIEIIPPSGGEFDYENKYNGQTQELCPPQHISTDIQIHASKLAEQTHTIMGCRHLSRTDMILSTSGEIKILEINTLPGMTAESLYPKSAYVAGMPTTELVDKLVMMALAG